MVLVIRSATNTRRMGLHPQAGLRDGLNKLLIRHKKDRNDRSFLFAFFADVQAIAPSLPEDEVPFSLGGNHFIFLIN
jgi:hypothetical protein